MKKTLYTLNVDGYSPEITALTYPLLERYADRLGADFHVISERRFPDWPVVYEKLQIGDLARDHGNDWSIYIDSDALVHPETIDFTELVGKDTVLHNGADMAGVRWRYDKYFRRDGRHIGSCNWFTAASDWCLDLWTPLDITLEEALANIYPTVHEQNSGVIDKEHLIDDYTLSRNIAKFGLKFTTALALCETMLPGSEFFWHAYTVDADEKVRQMRETLIRWSLLDASESEKPPSSLEPR